MITDQEMNRIKNGFFMKSAVFPVAAAILLPVMCIFGCTEKEGTGSLPVSRFATVSSDNANMPSSGIITVEFSDSPEGSDISKIVDGDPSTAFMTYHDSFDIIFSCDASVAIVSYSMVSSPSSPENDPSSWTLSASADNKIWKKLDTRSDIVFDGRGEEKAWTIDNTASYKYFRLRIEANAGGSATSIAEWSLSLESGDGIRYKITEIPALRDYVSRMGGSTYSDATPMGTNYEGLHVTTDEDREWLSDPSTDDEIPVSAAGLSDGNFSWSYPARFVLYPGSNPRPADINQHDIGDCCLCAALAEMAYLYPEFIKSIITPNPQHDNAYDIAMFDPQGEPLTVSVTTSCLMKGDDIAALSGKNNTATWATLLEKAVMKWNVIYKRSTSLGGIGTELIPPLFVGDGGSMSFSPDALDVTELDRVVDILLENGVLVVGGFNQNRVQIGDTPNYTVSAHAFSFMLSPDPSALFMMRNPWGCTQLADGYSDGAEDGAMNIYDDGNIPPMIDLRVMEPGVAAPYLDYPLKAYVPPVF